MSKRKRTAEEKKIRNEKLRLKRKQLKEEPLLDRKRTITRYSVDVDKLLKKVDWRRTTIKQRHGMRTSLETLGFLMLSFFCDGKHRLAPFIAQMNRGQVRKIESQCKKIIGIQGEEAPVVQVKKAPMAPARILELPAPPSLPKCIEDS